MNTSGVEINYTNGTSYEQTPNTTILYTETKHLGGKINYLY